MNDLGYGQLSNPNKSIELVLMHGVNHQEQIIYFYYLGCEIPEVVVYLRGGGVN